VPARPRAHSRHALTAAYAAVREPEVVSITEGNFSHRGQVTVSMPNRYRWICRLNPRQAPAERPVLCVPAKVGVAPFVLRVD
jgi:hypothetical protein